MLARCLPILLLRVPSGLQRESKASMIVMNCMCCLDGFWRSLTLAAEHELEVGDLLAAAKNKNLDGVQPSGSEEDRAAQDLSKVRLLHYKKTINLLRSPGLARRPRDEVIASLKAQRPAEPTVPMPSDWSNLPASSSPSTYPCD